MNETTCQLYLISPLSVGGDFPDRLDRALAADGPMLVEVDMCAIGPFAQPFAGPPAGAAGKEA